MVNTVYHQIKNATTLVTPTSLALLLLSLYIYIVQLTQAFTILLVCIISDFVSTTVCLSLSLLYPLLLYITYTFSLSLPLIHYYSAHTYGHVKTQLSYIVASDQYSYSLSLSLSPLTHCYSTNTLKITHPILSDQ